MTAETSTTASAPAPTAARGTDTAASPTPTGPIPVPADGSPRLDVEMVSEALLGSWADARRDARERAARPELHRPMDASVAEHRERVFGQLADDTVVLPGHGDSTTVGQERPKLDEWRQRGW